MRNVKKTLGMILGLVILGILVIFLLNYGKKEVIENDPSVLHITILDSEEYYYSDAGIDHGIKMALEKIAKERQISVELEIVDDGGDYVTGISMAQSLAEDPKVDVVISFQNFDAIGSEAEIFEKAKKPFIVTMGCYDEVAENGYQYFLADFLSGQAIGARIGEYLKEQGVNNIALCHSNTIFERDEIRGLQSVIKDTKGMSVRDTMTGPFHSEELASLLSRCEQFEIEAVVANFYNQDDSAWLISQLRTLRPDLVVAGDYALDSTDILEVYGKELEGAVIVPVYPYVQSKKLEEFIKEYEAVSGEQFSTAAVQYYDLFQMLAQCYEKSGNLDEMMQELKSEEGYNGIAGKIRFDANGRLQAEECPIFVCRNGEFVFEK